MKFYGLVQDGYARFTLKPEMLAALKTAVPAKRVEAAATASLRFDRLSSKAKLNLNAGYREGLPQQRVRRPGETDVAYRNKIAVIDAGLSGFTTMINDGKEAAVDLTIDRKAGAATIKLKFSSVAGSSIARTFEKFPRRSGAAAALSRGGVVSVAIGSPVAESLRKILLSPTDAAADAALAARGWRPGQLELGRRFFATVHENIDSPDYDAAIGVLGPFQGFNGKPNVALIAGAKLKNARAAEALFREMMKKFPPQAGATLDADKSNDGATPIHRYAMQLPFIDTVKLLGAVNGYVAFRDDMVILTLGERSLSAMKSVLDAIRRPIAPGTPPVEIAISGSRLPAALAAYPGPVEQAARTVFQGADAARDQLRVTLQPEGDSMVLRLKFDLPVLQFLMLVSQQI
jgi:hypothetical protein